MSLSSSITAAAAAVSVAMAVVGVVAAVGTVSRAFLVAVTPRVVLVVTAVGGAVLAVVGAEGGGPGSSVIKVLGCDGTAVNTEVTSEACWYFELASDAPVHLVCKPDTRKLTESRTFIPLSGRHHPPQILERAAMQEPTVRSVEVRCSSIHHCSRIGG